jgi:hypothetical protein
MMGEDRNGLPKVLEEVGWQDVLLSYLGGRVMMGQDRIGTVSQRVFRRMAGRTTF